MTEVTTIKPELRGQSPWGVIQDIKTYENGILYVSTPSHGGMWVPDLLIDDMSKAAREYAAQWSHGWGDQWFEHDLAIAFVVGAFPKLFKLSEVRTARRMILDILEKENECS